MRDHRKLRAFDLADSLTLNVYAATRTFPDTEKFGLVTQLRRAAVSIVSNIVEGSARSGHGDYVRFIDMAFGSAKEVQYQLTLARRLGYLEQERAQELENQAEELCRVLRGLLRSLRKQS